MKGTPEDKLMARAVDLALRGWPAPNPRVGCVLEKGGEVVGEGWCPLDGGEHAEAMALRLAGDRAQGATAYVTLEPCSHQGRTPPCAGALIKAQVKRVVVACPDPHPLAAGGAAQLHQAGIEVVMGVGAREAAWMNRQFLFWAKTGLPYASLKAAVTLDGFLARPDGSSKWITSEEARLEGRKLRVERGAVAVGRRTAELDQPLLTARVEGAQREPTRLVVDPQGRLDPSSALLQGERVLWLTSQALQQGHNSEARDSRFSARQILEAAGKAGERGLLVEGGAQLLRTFLEEEAAQELHLFAAPKAWGQGLSWTAGWEGSLSDQGFEREAVREVGPDVWTVWTKKSQILGTILGEDHSQ